MPDKLRIGLLGPLTIEGGGALRPPLRSATQRRLLSILALQVGHVLSADRLCELLDCSPGSLRTSVSRLRASIGIDGLRTSPPGYVLVATTDVGEVEALVAEAESTTVAPSIAILDRALALWRGEVVEEFRDEAWAIHEAARLGEVRAAAVERRADALVATGHRDQAIADLRSHVGRHPLREHPHATLMQALADSGRSTEALRVYQDFRRHLATTTGTEPSGALRALEASIARGPTGGDVLAATPVEARAFLAGVVVPPRSGADEGADPDGRTASALDDRWAVAVAENRGVEIGADGGALAAVFDDPDDAVAAAISVQQRSDGPKGPPTAGLCIGVHFGAAARRGERWSGPTVDEAHGIASVGHPGQVVASDVVAAMVDVRLADLGEHRLRHVEGPRRLFQVDLPGGPGRFPPLRSIGSHPSTLPAQRTRLIGREELVGQVRALVDDCRLVSLIGPGGVGKTRRGHRRRRTVDRSVPGRRLLRRPHPRPRPAGRDDGGPSRHEGAGRVRAER